MRATDNMVADITARELVRIADERNEARRQVAELEKKLATMRMALLRTHNPETPYEKPFV